jgi:hypothetical protein
MPTFGGMSPYPRRFGGGEPRVKTVLETLNADRGTAFDTSNREATVYVNDMAIARALSAAWGTNERLGNLWMPYRMSTDTLVRWEKILAINPSPESTEFERRTYLATLFSNFGQAAISGRITELLTEALGDAFVAVESISYANAVIYVPDGTYPWGSVIADTPWSSTVAHVLVRLQKPTGWSEFDFYEAAGRVIQLLEPILPVWTTVDWYRAGPVSVAVSGGPSAGGFYLDDEHNLDNECFDE